MLVPGVRHGFHPPRSLLRIAFAVLVVASVVGAWAVFAPGNVSTDGPMLPFTANDRIRSIVYIEPRDGRDHVMIRSSAPGSEPTSVYSFDIAISGIHARGASSPNGERAAVLHSGTSAAARMTLLRFRGSSVDVVPVDSRFDHLSQIAWAVDSARLSAVRTVSRSEGTGTLDVIEIDAVTGDTRVVATVERAREVAPVGYSIDGERLFWVVVDNAGSNLWMERRGEIVRVGELSPGRTTDWSLSPDGSRLAFIDIVGAGARTHVGRTMAIATGAITTLPATGNQIGTVWRPGAVLPEFGGPGGSLQLSEPTSEAAYIRPERWSPAGDLVVASVFAEGSDRFAPLVQAIEIGSADRRELVTDVQGASFLGWIRDVEFMATEANILETAAWQ